MLVAAAALALLCVLSAFGPARALLPSSPPAVLSGFGGVGSSAASPTASSTAKAGRRVEVAPRPARRAVAPSAPAAHAAKPQMTVAKPPTRAPPSRAQPPRSPPLEAGADSAFVRGAALDAVNPAGAAFDYSDPNRPTRARVPPDGFAPRGLPPRHPLRALLRRLRARTVLRPRWPDHPEIHLQALRSYGPAYASIIISEKLKVVYVPVFKVGTTSMMWNIAFLENIRDVVTANMSNPAVRDTVLHDVGSKAWRNHAIWNMGAAKVRSILNNPQYLKFGFVRNPYHRVISAYLDKVVKWGIDSEEYQTQMFGLYGNNRAMRKLRNVTKPTFKEFLVGVERVISMPRTKSTDLSTAEGYEDNSSRREIHWRPQVELLHPDLIHFDFIGKFGRMDKDKEHVLEWMYRHTDRRMPPGRRRMHTTNPKDKVALLNLLRKDPEAKRILLMAYKSDFERFGFSKEIPPVNEHSA